VCKLKSLFAMPLALALLSAPVIAESLIVDNPNLSQDQGEWTRFGDLSFSTDEDDNGVMNLHGSEAADSGFQWAGIAHGDVGIESIGDVSAEIAIPSDPVAVEGNLWVYLSGEEGYWALLGMVANGTGALIYGAVQTPDSADSTTVVLLAAELDHYYSLRIQVEEDRLLMFVDEQEFVLEVVNPATYDKVAAFGRPTAGGGQAEVKGAIRNLQVSHSPKTEILWSNVQTVHSQIDATRFELDGELCNTTPDGTQWRVQAISFISNAGESVEIDSAPTGEYTLKDWGTLPVPHTRIYKGIFCNCETSDAEYLALEEFWGGRFSYPDEGWEDESYSVETGPAQQALFLAGNSFGPFPIPQVSISGTVHPTVAWSSIENAASYDVSFFLLEDGKPVTSPESGELGSPLFAEYGLDTTSFQYTGDLFESGKSYAVAVTANEHNADPTAWNSVNVSFFLTRHSSILGLYTHVLSLDLSNGVETSLTSRLEAAENSVESDNINATLHQLRSLLNFMHGQAKQQLTAEELEQLLGQIQTVIDGIEHQASDDDD
jgi:hypothetical protein